MRFPSALILVAAILGIAAFGPALSAGPERTLSIVKDPTVRERDLSGPTPTLPTPSAPPKKQKILFKLTESAFGRFKASKDVRGVLPRELRSSGSVKQMLPRYEAFLRQLEQLPENQGKRFHNLSQWFEWKGPTGTTTPRTLKTRYPGIFASVSATATLRNAYTPNDYFFHDPDPPIEAIAMREILDRIQAERAWDLSVGQGVVLGLADTGLHINHPDLQNQLWINQGELINPADPAGGYLVAFRPEDVNDGYVSSWDLEVWLDQYNEGGRTGDFNGNGAITLHDAIYVDPANPANSSPLMDGRDGLDGRFGGGNGYVDDLLGWDFVDAYDLRVFDQGQYRTATRIAREDYATEDNNITPDIGRHGTWVAGIMAAEGDDGSGVAGIAFKSRIMLLRTAVAHSIWPQGDHELDDVARAIAYAHSTSDGPRVFTMPFTETMGVYIDPANQDHTDQLQFLRESIDNAVNDEARGILFVASAGNAGRRSDGTVFPADWDTVLSVGGVTSAEERFGNYGPHVDLAAPATDLVSADPRGLIGDLDGTSFAAPLVAGTAGLIFAVNPALTHRQVMELLKANTDRWDENGLPNNVELGTGRLNVFKAVAAAVPSVPVLEQEVERSHLGSYRTFHYSKLVRHPGDSRYLVFLSNRDFDDQTLAEKGNLAAHVRLSQDGGTTWMPLDLTGTGWDNADWHGGADAIIRPDGTIYLAACMYAERPSCPVLFQGHVADGSPALTLVFDQDASGLRAGVRANELLYDPSWTQTQSALLDYGHTDFLPFEDRNGQLQPPLVVLSSNQNRLAVDVSTALTREEAVASAVVQITGATSYDTVFRRYSHERVVSTSTVIDSLPIADWTAFLRNPSKHLLQSGFAGYHSQPQFYAPVPIFSPKVAVHPSQNPLEERIFFAYTSLQPAQASPREQSLDILLRVSHDGGRTWGPAIPIAQGPVDEFAPDLEVDALGRVHLAWFAHDYASAVNIRYARFDNSGVSESFVVNDQPIPEYYFIQPFWLRGRPERWHDLLEVSPDFAYVTYACLDETIGFDTCLAKIPAAPDQARFIRGDANSSAAVDISDAVFTLGFLFLGEAEPPCLDAADANDSGLLDLSDALYTLQFLFLGAPAPPEPWTSAPGPDPTLDELGCAHGLP